MAKKIVLTPKQLQLAAAILGVSNTGQDYLFLGIRPNAVAAWTPEKVRKLYERGDDADGYTLSFVRNLCENEEMLEMFQDEVKSWVKMLKKDSLDDLRRVHKHYAAFWDVIA
jgi:hypothetical protein